MFTTPNLLSNTGDDITPYLSKLALLPNSDIKAIHVSDGNLAKKLQIGLTQSMYYRILLPLRELGLVEWCDKQDKVTVIMLIDYILEKVGLPKNLAELMLKDDTLFLYNNDNYDTLVKSLETIFVFIAKYIFLLTGENVSTPDKISVYLYPHTDVVNLSIDANVIVMRINLDKYIGKDLFRTGYYHTVKCFDNLQHYLTLIDQRYGQFFNTPFRYLEYLNEVNHDFIEKGIMSNGEFCSYINGIKPNAHLMLVGNKFFNTLLGLFKHGIKGRDIPTNSKEFRPWFLANEKLIIKVKCQILGLDDKWSRWVTDRYLFGDHEAKEQSWLFNNFFADTQFLCLLSIGRLSSDVSFVRKRIQRNFNILNEVIIGRDKSHIEANLEAYGKYLNARNWYDGYTNMEMYGHKVPLHHHTILEKATHFLVSNGGYFDYGFGLFLKEKFPDVSGKQWSELVLGSIKERELAVKIYGEYYITSFGTEEQLTTAWISEDEIKNSPLGYLDDKWIILKNPLELLSWASRFKNCSFQYSEDCDICNQMILIYTGFEKPVMVQIDFTAYEAGWFYTIGLEEFSTEEMSRYIGSICEAKNPLNETLEPENDVYLNDVYTHAINQYLLKELDGPNNVFTENAYGLTTSMIKEAIANFVFEHDLLKANL